MMDAQQIAEDKEELVGQDDLMDGNQVEDIFADVPLDVKDIDLTHQRLRQMPAGLGRFKELRTLGLRQNLLQSFAEGFPTINDNPVDAVPLFADTLEELDLYDNRLVECEDILSRFCRIRHLDLSFNIISEIKNLERMVSMESLYLCQNKISRIQNLSPLSNLRVLELGANRIKNIEGLDSLVNLQELYLGKNRISTLDGLASLKSLRLLSIQSNRITSLSGIDVLANSLEELYISHNGISTITHIDQCDKLTTLDIANNRISRLENLKCLKRLEDLWIADNQLTSYEEVEQELSQLPKLNCVYLERNPLASDTQYRLKVKLALPQLFQLDATHLKATT